MADVWIVVENGVQVHERFASQSEALRFARDHGFAENVNDGFDELPRFRLIEGCEIVRTEGEP